MKKTLPTLLFAFILIPALLVSCDDTPQDAGTIATFSFSEPEQTVTVEESTTSFLLKGELSKKDHSSRVIELSEESSTAQAGVHFILPADAVDNTFYMLFENQKDSFVTIGLIPENITEEVVIALRHNTNLGYGEPVYITAEVTLQPTPAQ